MGVRLFERFRNGYMPTAAGDAAMALAGRFEEEILALERKLSGQDLQPTGTVRITTTDTLGLTIVMPHLAAFRAAHPDIRVEMTISNEMANLTRREADIAIRPTAEPPASLVGRRIAGIAFAVYGTAAQLPGRRASDVLATRDWIGLDDALAGTVTAHWLRDNVPDARIHCRVDSLVALREAARAGLGLALLPCFLGDSVVELRRATRDPLPEPRSEVWLLTHEDLKRTARIRAVMDFLAQGLASQRALLEGRSARRP